MKRKLLPGHRNRSSCAKRKYKEHFNGLKCIYNFTAFAFYFFFTVKGCTQYLKATIFNWKNE